MHVFYFTNSEMHINNMPSISCVKMQFGQGWVGAHTARIQLKSLLGMLKVSKYGYFMLPLNFKVQYLY